ncbi:protein-L-isoaspartate O-methyltransferase [Sphingomonas sp. ID1715]|uniref:protein-L-isoaspartate O-methyltransferase family protein n=1 Tax=Sphingomonas sp. ID1715 TaxID=1656898 RepID=UPI0014885DD9|nr:protein-L-isoaspartate O-methyltransferase [Sphingomonas sp. ID1715]NNM77964.1 protein-L-isoaspartate O-methyltransferase [Sphingomonas sp. ID1715]
MTEQSFEAMRRAMVESQLRTTGVNDPRVIAAMAAVPRERFVPEEWRTLAYMDRPVPVGGGRELNMPEATGRLLTAAAPTRHDRVLLVGAATGYTAALLAQLAGQVVALEEDADLSGQAVENDTVERVQGPLAQGWAAGAPYDLIFIDGAIEQVPDALLAQLKEGGRLAAAIHEKGATRLGIGRKSGNGFGMDLFADCEAVRLPGFERPKSFVF